MSPLFSVIIPHWNAIQYLTTCLDALANQTYEPIEVILVDNASSDGSAAFVREQYPWVNLIELPENRGFTGACNAGIAVAKGEIIALLNNDTEVDSGWAQAVVDAFARHPEVGMVASKMLLFDQRDRIHTAGDAFTIDGRALNRGVWQTDVGQFEREEYVFGACGGSSAYRRALLDEVGWLDDDFFFLLEDMDLAWRAQLVGWRALYTPHAIVYHHLSATGGGVTASYYAGRNSILVLVKNLPSTLWRRYRWRIVRQQTRQALQALRAWRGQAARARLRGMWAGLRLIPATLPKRRRIQAARRVADADIDALLSPPPDDPISHQNGA